MSHSTAIALTVVGLGAVAVLGFFVYEELQIQAAKEKQNAISGLVKTGVEAIPAIVALF